MGNTREGKTIDIAGQCFGSIEVLHRYEKRPGGYYWESRCGNCGRIFWARGTDLRRGRIASCGCIKGRIKGRQNGIIDSQNLLTCMNCPYPNCLDEACQRIKRKVQR